MIIKNNTRYDIIKYLTKLICLLLVSQVIPLILSSLIFHSYLQINIYLINTAGIIVISLFLYSVKQIEIIDKEIRIKYLFRKTIEITNISNSYKIIYVKRFHLFGEYQIINNKKEIIWKLREYEIEPKYHKELNKKLLIIGNK